MENKYLIKFRHKSKNELEEIVENAEKYTETALFAAKELLNNFDESELIKEKEEVLKSYDDGFSLIDFIHIKLNPIPFARSIKMDVLLTNLSLAFVLLTLDQLSRFLWDINDVFISFNENILFAIMFFLILNNVMYRMETGVSNNLIGRCLNDFLFLCLFILLRTVSNFIIDAYYSFPLPDIVTAILLLLFILSAALLFEVLVGLINRLMRKIDIRFV